MSKKEARKLKIEILDLKSEKREEAMKAYRKLLKNNDSAHELMYLKRTDD